MSSEDTENQAAAGPVEGHANDDAELPLQPEIEDAAWQAAAAEVVVAVPDSEADAPEFVAGKRGRGVLDAPLRARGSEDFLVSDSEGEGEGGVRAALDLGRFAFVPPR